MNGKAGLVFENEVSDLLGKLLRVSLHSAKLFSVDLEGHPSNLSFEVRHSLKDWQTIILAELADLSSCEWSDQCVLCCCQYWLFH